MRLYYPILLCYCLLYFVYCVYVLLAEPEPWELALLDRPDGDTLTVIVEAAETLANAPSLEEEARVSSIQAMATHCRRLIRVEKVFVDGFILHSWYRDFFMWQVVDPEFYVELLQALVMEKRPDLARRAAKLRIMNKVRNFIGRKAIVFYTPSDAWNILT